MISLFFIFIIGLSCWDVNLLLRRGATFKKKNYEFLQWEFIFILFIAIFLISLCPLSKEYVFFIIISFGIPFYLVFRKKLDITAIFKEQENKMLLLSDALEVCIVWLYSLVTSSFILRVIGEEIFTVELNLLELLITTIISSAVVLYFVFKASYHFSEKDFRHNLGLVKKGKSLVRIFIFPGLLGLCFAFVTGFLAVTRPVSPQTPLSDIIKDTHSPFIILLFVFLALFLAPIIEEIVFRGYFFVVLKRIRGKVFAILLVSTVFSLLHVGQYWGDWLAITVVSFLGITLTLMRSWSGSTLASISMHFIYNLSVTIAPILLLSIINPSYFQYQLYYEQLSLKEKKYYLEDSIKKQPYLADAYNDLA